MLDSLTQVAVDSTLAAAASAPLSFNSWLSIITIAVSITVPAALILVGKWLNSSNARAYTDLQKSITTKFQENRDAISRTNDKLRTLVKHFDLDRELDSYKDAVTSVLSHYVPKLQNPKYQAAVSSKGKAFIEAMMYILETYPGFTIATWSNVEKHLGAGYKVAMQDVAHHIGDVATARFAIQHAIDFKVYMDGLEVIHLDTTNKKRERFIQQSSAFLVIFIKNLMLEESR